MKPFTTLSGRAAPLMQEAINTDVIFPARFLLVMEKRDLGRYLFHDYRRGVDGAVTGGFVLDRPAFAGASILIVGAAFGCGSSREQAVWTLLGADIRCVIAPSFGEIFYSNCFKNGLLPIILDGETVARLATLAEDGARFEVDLLAQIVRVEGEAPISFSIAPERRQALLNGLDDIDEILVGSSAAIASFEAVHRRRQPWLFEDQPAAAAEVY
jgi:3-isopropylmalate/(R)-2-methylmalate dehydratase small subunit